MNEQLFSLQVERHLLAGIIKYPDTFFDIDQSSGKDLFFNEVHKTIYIVIGSMLMKGERRSDNSIDSLIIGQKIRDMGIRFNDEIEIIDYVTSISLVSINKENISSFVDELEKLRVCREIYRTGEKIIKQVKSFGDKTIAEIINSADKIYHETVKLSSIKEKDSPKRMLDGIIEIIEERSKNPVKEIGLLTPHQLFNNKFGGLRNGNVYAFVSRPGHGKSTILNDMAIKCTQLNPGCKALILDTEMNTVDMNFRAAASLSNIPMWYLETGNWIKRQDYIDAWNNAKKFLKENRPVDHVQVAGKPILEICSLIRRWFYKNIDRSKGESAIIVYDYIKLTGETNGDLKEYQLIGEKVNTLKLITDELEVPLLTACQLNRNAEEGTDDSSVIALSDRLQWFSSFVGIFRKKRMEEFDEHGQNFGTHALIPLKYRFEGRESFGHHDLIRIEDENARNGFRYVRNYLNFHVENFNVTERGDLRDVYNNLQLLAVQNNNGPEEPVNL